VQHVDIILDNRVQCSFIETSEVENIIFCRPLEESLDNISVITTNDSEFVHSYVTEGSGNYLVTDVALSDGTVYEGVKFKIVPVEEGKKLPPSIINPSTFGTPSATDILPPVRIVEEEHELITEEVEADDDFGSLYGVSEIADNSDLVQKVKVLESKLIEEQKKLEVEKIELSKQRTILEADRKLQKTLEDYKSELLQETFRINDHQKSLLEKAVSDLNDSLQGQFDNQQINVNRYLDTLAEANLVEVKKYQDKQVVLIKEDIQDLLLVCLDENSVENDKLLLERTAKLEAVFTEKLITELEEHKRNVNQEIESITNTLNVLIDEKLKTNNDNVDQLLVNRTGILQDQFNEAVDSKLAEHKVTVFDEVLTRAQVIIDGTLGEYKDSFNTSVVKTVNEVASTFNEHKDELKQIFTEKSDEVRTEIAKVTKDFEDRVPVLEDRIAGVETVINDHRKNLNDLAAQKIVEVSDVVKKFGEEVQGKLPVLDTKIVEINKQINTILNEKRALHTLIDGAKQYTDSAVSRGVQDAKEYARRILDLGSGGGSNAVQFAEGGTMNGSLNVTGQYLSGGIDISTLFGHGGGASNATFSPYVTGSGVGAIQPLSGSNTASGNYSFVAGGYGNNASGYYSSILGGYNNNTNNQSNTFILGSDITAISANYTYVNNISSLGTIAAANITINKAPTTFVNPVTASGTFLTININGVNKAIQLWDYSS
jgi:hypothetical protein